VKELTGPGAMHCLCNPQQRSRMRPAARLMLALAVAFLPKCPMCLIASLGLSGSFAAGLGSILYGGAQVGLLSLPVLFVIWCAYNTKRWSPAIAALAAIGLLVFSKFELNSTGLTILGAAGLGASLFWAQSSAQQDPYRAVKPIRSAE